MSRNLIFLLSFTVILVTTHFTWAYHANSPNAVSRLEKETAINQAQYLYRQSKDRGRDFSNGPCLSDALLPNWVVDIVHNPRDTIIDDLVVNQCPSFVEGRRQHFVELDTEGNLIRVQ